MKASDFGETAFEVLSLPHVRGSLERGWERRVAVVALSELSKMIVLRPAPSCARYPDRCTIGQCLSPSSESPLIGETTTPTDGALSGSKAAPVNRFTYGRNVIQIRYSVDNGKIEYGEFATQRDNGLFYLYILIHSPYKLIRAAELESLLGRWKSERRHKQESLNDGFGSQWTFDPTIDSRGLAEIDAALKAIRNEIEEAKESNDTTRVIQLQDHQERLRAQVASDFLGKRAKSVDLEQERLRDRVRKALATARKRIFDQMPIFAAHLTRTTFNLRGAWSYRPPSSSGTWAR
jgi:hypothetical protein